MNSESLLKKCIVYFREISVVKFVQLILLNRIDEHH